MNIEKLEAVAKAALKWSDAIGEHAWYTAEEMHTVGAHTGLEVIGFPDAAHIAAFNPATALALLAVVRAAKEWHMTEDEDTVESITADFRLHEALCALDGKGPDGEPLGNSVHSDAAPVAEPEFINSHLTDGDGSQGQTR